jgi:localization factor PodJL
MHNLATLLAAGAGGKPDYAAALRWYLEAAEAGVRDSQFNIGVLFARAVGTRPDLAQSYKWFALAAAQGDPEAARKRDEMAARLNPSDLASVRAAVERWRPRAVDISANEVAIPAESASLRAPAHNRI